MLVARPVLFLYFFTVPYAVCYNFLIRLFLNNGLVSKYFNPMTIGKAWPKSNILLKGQPHA